MNNKPIGANLQGGDEEARKKAASMMGKARTERKYAAAVANAQKRKGKPLSEEHKAKLREAQQERREREQVERAALGLDAAEGTEKKPVGRPRKATTAGDTHSPKRGRGRPKKSETQNAINAPENGT